MNTKMTVSTKKKTVDGKTFYEGLVTLPSLSPTKLRKSDNTTFYSSEKSVTQAAQKTATKYGLQLEVVETVAAKKSKNKPV
jgi:hypothetical protein